MAKQAQVRRCNICGNIITVLHSGGGEEIICCGEKMQIMEPNTVGAAREKHVPVIEKTGSGVKVKIGAVPHPMEAKHYIEWAEISAGPHRYLIFLNPGEKPEAEFCIKADKVTAFEYCNLHGYWKGE